MNEPAGVEEVARELADAFEDQQIPYALGGALALGIWSTPRGTTDVDVNVWIDPLKPTAAAEILHKLGCDFQATAVIREFAAKGMAYVTRRGVRVDVYLPVSEFHQEVLHRRRKASMLGRDAWFLSPEDLAVFKLMFGRTKDRADLEALLIVQGSGLERDYIRRWSVRILGAGDPRLAMWDEVVAVADAALRARGEKA